MDKLFYIIIGLVILVLLIYLFISIFLNKLNKVIYKKGTIMAFLPVFNIYLLGKLTINKMIGWLLVLFTFITGVFIASINGNVSSFDIIPSIVCAFISSITCVMLIILFIFAIVKYNKLKNRKFKEVKPIIDEEDIISETSDILTEVEEVKKIFITPFEDTINVIHPLLQDNKKDDFAIPDIIELSNDRIEENNADINEIVNNCNDMINTLTNIVINNNVKAIKENYDEFDSFFDNTNTEELNSKDDKNDSIKHIPYEEIKTIPDDILDNDVMENSGINNNSFEDNKDDFIPDMIG